MLFLLVSIELFLDMINIEVMLCLLTIEILFRLVVVNSYFRFKYSSSTYKHWRTIMKRRSTIYNSGIKISQGFGYNGMSLSMIASMAAYAENIFKYWLEISFETGEFREFVLTGFFIKVFLNIHKDFWETCSTHSLTNNMNMECYIKY